MIAGDEEFSMARDEGFFIAVVELTRCGSYSGMYIFIRIAVRRSNTDMELYMNHSLSTDIIMQLNRVL